MSGDYMTLAWRTELQSGPRLVLLAICDNANDDGNCYPSIQGLAHKSGLSVRAVRGHVAAMAESGLLLRNERAGRSTYYQINLPALRAAVFKSLSARKELSDYDRGVLRSCAPDPVPTPPMPPAPPEDTPADSAPRQILPTPPADSAGDPSRFLPTPSADSAARTYKEPTSNQQGKKKTGASAPKIPGVSDELISEWNAVRKAKRAGPISQTVIDALYREAGKAGITPEDAVRHCVERGWQGFQADWLNNGNGHIAGKQQPPAKFGGAAAAIYDGVNL